MKLANHLKEVALKGAGITAYSVGAITILQIVQTAMLGRMLGPETFGLIALLTLMIEFVQLFSSTIHEVIIQKKTPSKQELSSLFWFMVFFSLLMMLIVNLLAIFIPEGTLLYAVKPLIPAISTLFLLAAIASQIESLTLKALQFHISSHVNVVATLLFVCISLGGAFFLDDGVWFYVIGQLAFYSSKALLLLIHGMKHQMIPTFHFRYADLKDYLGFGFYRLGASVVNYFNARMDQMIVAVLFGPHILSFYAMANKIVLQPILKINPIIMKVSFPIFSNLNDNEERLRRGYLYMLKLLTISISPVLIGMAVIAPTAVPLLLGDSWSDSVPLIQMLAAYAFIRSMNNSNNSLILAAGKAKFTLYWNILIAGVSFPAMYFIGGLTSHVYSIALVLIGVHAMFVIILHKFMVCKLIGTNYDRVLASIGYPLLPSVFMGLLTYLLGQLISIHYAMISMVVQAIFGVSVYMVFIMLLQKPLWQDVMQTLRRNKRRSSSEPSL